MNTSKQEKLLLSIDTRYSILGISSPSTEEMINCECEGTRWIPVKRDTTNPLLLALFLAAEAIEPTDDGWHFVRCDLMNVDIIKTHY